MSRRRFLAAGGAAALAGAGGVGFWIHRSRIHDNGARPIVGDGGGGEGARGKGLIVGPCKIATDGEPTQYFLTVLDLDRDEPEADLTALDFHAHGVSPLPHDPGKAILFEKQGPGSCLVDLRKGEVVRPIETSPSRHFYGHGAWSPDGKIVYSTETVLEDQSGTIVVRDGASFEVLGRFPTFGANPHDCRFLDEGRVLAITNGGGPMRGSPPSVTYVDVASERLIEKIEFESPRINAGHLMLTSRGGLAVVSAPRDGLPKTDAGAISLRPAGSEDLITMTEPADVVATMTGETLSVAIHEPTGTVGATNPAGDLVTFWNLETRTFRKEMRIPMPTGITLTLDGRHFVICYSPRASSLFVDAITLEPVPGGVIEYAYLTGSHIITHTMPDYVSPPPLEER